MLALILLVFCFGTGLFLLRFFSPLQSQSLPCLWGGRTAVFTPFLRLPAAFVLGVITLGWCAYLTGLLFAGTGAGIRAAGVAGLALGGLCTFLLLRSRRAARSPQVSGSGGVPEMIVLAAALLFGWLVTFFCFTETAGEVKMAVNIYSDFSPHIAMIRSFSRGDNFPTQYPHFADRTIRYHFLFVFFTGLLESLGLPLTAAFNLPSLLGFVSMCLLLYTLAHGLTGSKAAGVVSVFLLYFRSGLGFFYLLAERPEDCGLFSYLAHNTLFLGITQHEDWGLFNQNVWANQRHLSLGICLVLLAVLYYLDLFIQGVEILQLKKPVLFAFSPSGWLPERLRLFGLPMGLLLGAAGFWHGSMVICSLLILACMAAFSTRRLTYLCTALPAVLLSSLQSRLFTGGGNPLQLKWAPGFLAEGHALRQIVRYVWDLTGVLFPLTLLLAAVLFVLPSLRRGAPKALLLLFAFFTPTLLAFTLQMTPDVAVAHKQVMLTCILLDALLAFLPVLLWRRGLPGKALCLLVVFLLTCTGAEDLITYINRCREGSINIAKQDEIVDWLDANTAPGSVFLTGYITVHPVFTAGRLTLQGWPYYAWSAGYETTGRDETLVKAFHAPDESLAQALYSTGADYIYVDESLTSDERFAFFFNEDGEARLAELFPLVYASDRARIYSLY